VQVGARSVLLEGSMMEDYSVLQPGSVLPPTRRVPTGARQQQCSWHLYVLQQPSSQQAAVLQTLQQWQCSSWCEVHAVGPSQ
jgi:hypothetical protein